MDENQTIDQDRILKINIEEEMKKSYIDYSMSVIVSRALPDVRDGFKPVHRRILYGMLGIGNTSSNPYKKCARVVGEVLGKYHPHGDSSVYGALVRMGQDWNMRYMLVDGQGNFGSVDGDSPAAVTPSADYQRWVSTLWTTLIRILSIWTPTSTILFLSRRLCLQRFLTYWLMAVMVLP